MTDRHALREGGAGGCYLDYTGSGVTPDESSASVVAVAS